MLRKEVYKKELTSLVEDTGVWVPVPLEQSLLFRSIVPDPIMQPRPRLRVAKKDDGLQGAKRRCTPQGFKDPDVLDLV